MERIDPSSALTPSVEEIERCAGTIAPLVTRTPVVSDPVLASRTRADVVLKLENLQVTGSFKARGAANKLLTLTEAERARGVTTASSGNHGAAVSYACSRLGVRARIFVPQGASRAKVAKIEEYGGAVEFFGTDGLDTEHHARAVAARDGQPYISPYNDVAVIAGQGSLGVEVLQQVPGLRAVYVAVGGGGLIGGVARVLKGRVPGIRVIGASPRHSAVMHASVWAGRVLELQSLPTLSDGTAGGVEADSRTFPLCRDLVDEWVLVSEQEIADAMRTLHETHRLVVEGAAGVAWAAAARHRAAQPGERVAVVLCGGNVAPDVRESVLGV